MGILDNFDDHALLARLDPVEIATRVGRRRQPTYRWAMIETRPAAVR